MASSAREIDIDGQLVKISSPDKVYFPELGLSKFSVVEYALAVGSGLLHALRDRPTTMERWPEGVVAGAQLSTPESKGSAFFAKKAPAFTPDWIQQATVTFPSGRSASQVAPHDLASIIWMMNLGTLRFHAWPVRADAPDVVDQLRIDLDPQPGTSFGDAITAAQALKELMEGVGLTPYVKTSGGRGLHVYAAIEPADFIDTRHAAIALGRQLVQQLPDLVTVNWWKEERGQRIFLDYNQNARDRLMASAYSIRPLAQARVSMPVSWEELPTISPDDFTVVSAPERFADCGDLWAGLGSQPGSIATLVAQYAASAEGEMPYPPEYPKMPGEPPRVQPSKAKKA